MLKKSTILFLKEIKQFNNRPWFLENKAKYQDAKEDFEQFVATLLERYAPVEPALGILKAKDCTFRIYRDVRFSNDKTPYKTHFAASIQKGGKKVHFPGFYLHIEPGAYSIVGGGIWRPEKEALGKIRQEIDYNLADFLNIVERKSFRKLFGGLSEEDKLVRPPKGYEEGNPAIAYLKLKSFFADRPLRDDILTSEELVDIILESFKEIKSLNDFLETAMDD